MSGIGPRPRGITARRSGKGSLEDTNGVVIATDPARVRLVPRVGDDAATPATTHDPEKVEPSRRVAAGMGGAIVRKTAVRPMVDVIGLTLAHDPTAHRRLLIRTRTTVMHITTDPRLKNDRHTIGLITVGTKDENGNGTGTDDIDILTPLRAKVEARTTG